MDDWDAEVDDGYVKHAIARSVSGLNAPDAAEVAALAGRISGAANPVMIAGPDIDASGAWDAAVAFAEAARLPVFAVPAPGGGRIGFPEGHELFRGVLPPAIGPVSETLSGYDLVLVVGSSVFPYYPNLPGPLLPEGASSSRSPPTPTRRAGRRWATRSSPTSSTRSRR